MIEEYEYNNLINPSNLFGVNNIKEVLEFISLSDNIEELKAFNTACLNEELYEYCQVINTKINELRGNTLS